tara:strand:- start:673 stop:1059 length:387 start_codon:yes stop_codon:yes gene_type:complete
MQILSEISAGELLDKISILEIKLEKIINEDDKKVVKKEYDVLKKTLEKSIKLNDELKDLYSNLKNTNTKLWEIEDKIRISEKNKKFDQNFIELARSVYFNNDQRSKIKLQINKILKSNIREIKQYIKY